MNPKNRVTTIIRWTARIWGSVSLIILLFIVGAHLLATITGKGEPIGHFRSVSEMISFAFFPASVIIGLGLALKWEGLGGLITILGIIGFHTIRPDLFPDMMIDGLAIPGLFYLAYWFMLRGMKNNNETV